MIKVAQTEGYSCDGNTIRHRVKHEANAPYDSDLIVNIKLFKKMRDGQLRKFQYGVDIVRIARFCNESVVLVREYLQKPQHRMK